MTAKSLIIRVTFLCLSVGAGLPNAPAATEEFDRVAFDALPAEKPYTYHEQLKTGPVHALRRDPVGRPEADEMTIPDQGWQLKFPLDGGPVLSQAVTDFQDYLATSMKVAVTLRQPSSLGDWERQDRSIVVGTRESLPGCGAELRSDKDYRLVVSPGRIVVCGYDEKGAAYGLYNLEARMNLREGPYLPEKLDSARHSLYRTRMVLNWLGWMEWPDNYLSHLAHDGFDAIYASVYANPNGAEGTAHYVLARKQDPAAMKDLIERASRFGIKVYTPLLYRYTGEPENQEGLRQLVRDILTELPEIQGFILLTEGFFYDRWFGAGGQGQQDLREWARQWTQAVEVVVQESQRIKPGFEVLPWEYNIDFRPQQVDLKRYFISQLPEETIPFLTWENGKEIEVDGLRGFIRDYSISVVGPSEVTRAQIAEAKRRGMRVYTKADTFASWQFGTTPYIPAPYQWYRRYQALEKYQVDGTHESWSYGYKPNFILEMRSWYCWTEAPSLDTLLRQIARRDFGAGAEDLVLDAWKAFSDAIQLLPDTGPSMGTNFAVGNPLFFNQPEPRTMTLGHSWWDQEKWKSHLASRINPYWPYTRNSFTFMPDFTNQVNQAERYAFTRSGISGIEQDPEKLKTTPILQVFNKGLLETADRLEDGLVSYREAALKTPPTKRAEAFKQVLLVEQMQRMLRSEVAILQFEDFRFRLVHSEDRESRRNLLSQMETILRKEIERTRLSLETSMRDSRLGYEMEMDYVYAPHVLRAKLEVLDHVLKEEIPEFRKEEGL